MTKPTIGTRLRRQAEQRAEAAEAEAERLWAALAQTANALWLILPLAKGYAHANNVGNNRQHVLSAEQDLEQARQALSNEPVREAETPEEKLAAAFSKPMTLDECYADEPDKEKEG